MKNGLAGAPIGSGPLRRRRLSRRGGLNPWTSRPHACGPRGWARGVCRSNRAIVGRWGAGDRPRGSRPASSSRSSADRTVREMVPRTCSRMGLRRRQRGARRRSALSEPAELDRLHASEGPVMPVARGMRQTPRPDRSERDSRSEAREMARLPSAALPLHDTARSTWPSPVLSGGASAAPPTCCNIPRQPGRAALDGLGALDGAHPAGDAAVAAERIWQDDRKTILFVTHDVDEALFLSDRVYLNGEPGRIKLS